MSDPSKRPSLKKSTRSTCWLSVAAALNETVPETVAPFDGLVKVAVGAALSTVTVAD